MALVVHQAAHRILMHPSLAPFVTYPRCWPGSTRMGGLSATLRMHEGSVAPRTPNSCPTEGPSAGTSELLARSLWASTTPKEGELAPLLLDEEAKPASAVAPGRSVVADVGSSTKVFLPEVVSWQ